MGDQVRDNEFAFDGKIVSIKKGVPVEVPVRIARPCRDGAFIKSNQHLNVGEKIGIIIFGLRADEFELLRYSDQPTSASSTLRTQAVVINATSWKLGLRDRIMQVGFVGNIHFDDAAEPVDIMRF